MWNIEYKGVLKGDIDTIASGKELPEGAVQFKEPDTTWEAFSIGTLILLPLILLMGAISWLRLKADYAGITKQALRSEMKSFVVAMGIFVALLIVSMWIHEYIHAVLFPRAAKKEVYVAPSSGALFVYSEDYISKSRFVIMSLGPAIVLGILPFAAWVILAQFIAVPVVLAVAVALYSICMVFSAVGDIVNVYNCIRQVPDGAKVFNHGYHSYWVKL
ncbi:DUF3267 domain-containing protein [Butyrivibrio sp. DSM 10294]|uniref:DUF3267 domain-containing protein n=1 Tax=Butyrivibrio sp. DSM 10294 TaxID=2972457 RepID=UPI00234EB780|nr:DUF3267 domain-containing protein [Butyrivibrio sp. DSM 10294]MDC7294441.1 DUF3267 domain-containing protein [Butyrivibrio sp. DSM 10294]